MWTERKKKENPRKLNRTTRNMLDTKQPVQSVAVVDGGMVLKCNPKECTSNNNNNNINNAIKFKQLPELKSNFVVSSATLIIKRTRLLLLLLFMPLPPPPAPIRVDVVVMMVPLFPERNATQPQNQ